MGKRVLHWIMALGGLYLLLTLLLFALQEQMIYLPGHRQVNADPDLLGLAWREFDLPVAEGVRVHGWLVPPPLVVELPEHGLHQRPPLWVHFSHGNAGNISHRLDTLRILHGLGLGVALYDYRGYGRSTGRPSEAGILEDSLAVWQLLRNEVPASRIILWGRSLGGAVAAQTAAALSAAGTPPAALVLESTFTSVVDMGRRSYPFLPVRQLCRHPHDALAHLAEVRCPVLVIHSPEDDIVPYTMGRKLLDAAPDPKELLEIRGDHNHGFLHSEEQYAQGLRDYLNRLPR